MGLSLRLVTVSLSLRVSAAVRSAAGVSRLRPAGVPPSDPYSPDHPYHLMLDRGDSSYQCDGRKWSPRRRRQYVVRLIPSLRPREKVVILHHFWCNKIDSTIYRDFMLKYHKIICFFEQNFLLTRLCDARTEVGKAFDCARRETSNHQGKKTLQKEETSCKIKKTKCFI